MSPSHFDSTTRRPTRLAVWQQLLLWLIVGSGLLQWTPPGVARAQDWEVMGVYIPSDPDQQRQVIPRNYVPIEIEDLENKLTQESARRREALLSAPGIAEAIYLARIEGELLTSECSRWRFRGSPTEQTFLLGKTSVALKEARGLDDSLEQLADYQRFNAEGAIELTSTGDQADRWFGFSTSGLPNTRGGRFELQFPVATVAKMLIATPSNHELSSPNVVIEALTDPSQQLPTDWPSGLSPDKQFPTAARWWLVNLSGHTSCTLDVALTQQLVGIWYKHTLRSVETEYLVGEESLTVVSKSIVAASAAAFPLRIRMSDRLRVKNVLVDGLTTRWRQAQSLSGESNLIELLDVPVSGSDMRIEVAATSQIEPVDEILLPELAVAEAYTMSGVTSVRAREGRTTDNVEAPGIRFQAAPSISAVAEVENYDDLLWTGNWIGNHPRVTAQFSRQNPQWRLETLTRFSLQNAWLSAHTRLRLSCDRLVSNEVRLQVASNWFVDSLKLISDSQGDIRARIVDVGSGTNRRTEIVVNWERNRDAVLIELDITAHSPNETRASQLQLSQSQLVSIPQAAQQDHYVIESLGRYRVQLNENLLKFLIPIRELPEWQQALIPAMSDVWIFQARRGTLPSIDLLASGGSFTAISHTLLATHADRTTFNYRWLCTPTAGSVENLKLLWPAHTPLDQLQFELLQNGDDSTLSIPYRVIDSADEEAEREIELSFPARTTPFEVRCSLTVSPSDSLRILVPGVPAAVTAESTVILPRTMAQFVGQPKIELLPARACCSDLELAELNDHASDENDTAFVAARLDAGESHVLEIDTGSTRSPRGWVWLESIEHRLWDDGSRNHDVRWELELGQQNSVHIQLPAQWVVERLLINGVEADDLRLDSDATLELALPANARSQVSLQCSSQSVEDAWWSDIAVRLELRSPTLDIPVFESRQQLLVSPSCVAVQGIAATSRDAKLADRLLPWSWWSLLAPSAFGGPSEAALSSGWSRVAWKDTNSRTDVWVAHRSAVAAVLLAGVLLVATGCWLLIGKSVRGWWLVLGLFAVAVILVPPGWVPWAQLVLLAASTAALLRLAGVVIGNQPTSKARDARGRPRSTVLARIAPLLLLTAGVSIYAPASAAAQPPLRNAISAQAAERRMAAEEEAAKPEIFGVLFPVDEESRLTGLYAYVPMRLWQLLTSPENSVAGTQPPKIVSADYLLRTRPASAAEVDRVQEFSVDLIVQVTQLNTELRLPFRASELELISGQVKGQERLIGLTSLRQEADQVVFQATETGTFPIRLQFVVNLNVDETERARLTASIPPVPNATLRIESEGLGKFDVNATGGVQRLLSGELLASLGPINQLDVTWTRNSRRNGVATPLDLTSETWIHASGDQTMAACQLRISQEQSLPPLLHVNIDSDWEPVGMQWGDAELTTSETPSFGSRRVYTIRLNNGATSANPSTVRVLLVPRVQVTATSLSLPFLSLQEVSQQATRRVLAWSSDGESQWKPDGVDFWPELTDATPNWGQLTLKSQKRVFRVPPGTGPLQLRRQPAPSPKLVEETTNVHLGIAEATIDYQASWEAAQTGATVLRLQIPGEAQVSSLLVNGEESRYRLSKRDAIGLLLIPLSSQKIDQVFKMDLGLSLPLQSDQPHRMPRVVLEDVAVKRSVYRLFRGSAVTCQLDSPNNELQLAAVEISPTTMLDNLEVLLGEIDLGSDYRQAPSIPLEATVSTRQASHSQSCLLTLHRGPDGWSAQVDAVWPATAELDFAFFDVPLSVRESIDSGTFVRKFLPAADAQRATLCLIPAVTPMGSKRVTFSFPLLTGVSSQSLSIPIVRLLAARPVPPAVALPRIVDGQRVTWSRAGRQHRHEWHEATGVPAAPDLEYYAFDENQTQVNWQPVEADDQPAVIQHVSLDIESVTDKRVAGIVDYWIAPYGQLEFDLRLPENCHVMGVETANTAAIWTLQDQGLLRVSLQPNYLPINVRVLLAWELDAAEAAAQVKMPQPIADDATGAFLVSLPNQFLGELHSDRGGGQVTQAPDEVTLERWLLLLSRTLQSQQGVSASELEIWLESWKPQAVGIAPQAEISAAWMADAGLRSNNESGEPLTAAEYWRSLLSGLRKDGATLAGAAEAASDTSLLQPTTKYAVSGTGIVLNKPVLEQNLLAQRVIAASLVAAAVLLSLILGLRLKPRYQRLLSAQPWVYWVQLAAVAWLLLPVSWPAIAIIAVAVMMLISQLFDVRQRTKLPQRG